MADIPLNEEILRLFLKPALSNRERLSSNVTIFSEPHCLIIGRLPLRRFDSRFYLDTILPFTQRCRKDSLKWIANYQRIEHNRFIGCGLVRVLSTRTASL